MEYIEISEYNNRQKAYMYSNGIEWEIPLETAKNLISQLNLTEDNSGEYGNKFNSTKFKRYYL